MFQNELSQDVGMFNAFIFPKVVALKAVIVVYRPFFSIGDGACFEYGANGVPDIV